MKPRAISLKDAAARLGMSYGTARNRMAAGTFPIPHLPRIGRSWIKFSERDLDRYLDSAATDDARRSA